MEPVLERAEAGEVGERTCRCGVRGRLSRSRSRSEEYDGSGDV